MAKNGYKPANIYELLTWAKKEWKEVSCNMKSKNQKLLNSFMKLCKEFPELRFYQALAVWAKVPEILIKKHSKKMDGNDTLYDTWEFKDKNK